MPDDDDALAAGLPGQPLPVLGPILAHDRDEPGMSNGGTPGVMSSEFYNSLGAMHGTIMVFLGIVPIAFAAFGNYVVPLQIGAPDMTFPKINMASYQSFCDRRHDHAGQLLLPGGPAKSGWTSYPPLADIADRRPTCSGPARPSGFSGMVFLITSSLLGSVNFITTIIQLRAPGMTWMRLPFFGWVQLVTAFILLLAFPPLEAAASCS